VTSCRWKKRDSELRLVRIRCRRSSATVSTKVRSGCSATTANTRSANFSRGETLPPRGFGAALLVSCQRCTHLTTELTLTPKCSAASRRDAPASTASITRSRRSQEYDFGIDTPQRWNQCSKTRSSIAVWGIPRFKSAGSRFSCRKAEPSRFNGCLFDCLNLQFRLVSHPTRTLYTTPAGSDSIGRNINASPLVLCAGTRGCRAAEA
jgi:hypothetical protein